MQLEAISCNNCGATLEVGESTRFVTCNYCNSRLEVKRTASTRYTALLEKIEGHAEAIAADTSVMRLKAEVELLESDWREKQAQAVAVPDGSSAEVCALIAVVAGVVAFCNPAPAWWMLWGTVAAICGVAGWGNFKLREENLRKHRLARAAEATYQQRKQELRSRLGITAVNEEATRSTRRG